MLPTFSMFYCLLLFHILFLKQQKGGRVGWGWFYVQMTGMEELVHALHISSQSAATKSGYSN